MKKYYGLLLFFIAAGLYWFTSCGHRNVHDNVPSPPVPAFQGNALEIIHEKSAPGTKENPQARSEYEQLMLLDPKTGEIPQDIRWREVKFSGKIPKKFSKRSNLRTGNSNEISWSSIGPYNIGGRTRAIAIDGTNENILLAGGVSGGMWRSENGGDTWAKTTVASNIHSVSCIAQDLRSGKTNIWYYGTGEFTSNSASKKSAPFRGDGVFKSIDGGKTWDQVVSTSEGVPNYYNSQFQYVWKLLPNPKNLAEDEVFLATVGAIFRSVDGGASWEIVLGRKAESTPETDLNNANLSDYADIAQTIDGVYYAVLSQQARNGSSADRGVYRSVDGVNWIRINNSIWPMNYARTVLATSVTNPDEVFFSINTGEEMLIKYTYVSGDGSTTGGIWEDLTPNLPSFGGEVGDYDSQNSYNMVLEVHPENGDVVFLGGTNLYRSNDGFRSNENTYWIGGYDTANNVKVFPNHYVDQHGLAFYPSDPNKMLSSNDGGVFVTDDNASESMYWRSLNRSFVTTQFYTIGLDEFNSKGDIMGGLQDNGTLIAKNPIDVSSWKFILTGDGGYSAISRNATFYYASYQFGKIYRFTLDKNLQTKSFTRIDPYGSGGEDLLLFVNPYVLAPENQHMMYFAGGDVVWRNTNTSQIPLFSNNATDINWQRMSLTELSHGIITAINASYNPIGIVYYGTVDGKLFRINDANELEYTVDEVTSVNFPEEGYVASIAIDRKDSRNIAIAFSNYNVISLFYSTDGGDSFENISGNLEENEDGSGSGPSVRWIEIVAKNQGDPELFAGTSTGIYSTNFLNGSNTIWEAEGTETVGNVLVTMIKYFSGDGTIIAATHGNGMYESKLDDVWKIEIEDQSQQLAFGNAFPNPFTSSVTIPFSLPREGMVRGRIYGATGQLIKTILWAEQYKGKNFISWNGTNEAGTRVASGSYICRLEFEDQQIGSRLIFMP